MKLSVHGSRALKDERVRILLQEEIMQYGITEVVTHGEPDGVCGVARTLCRDLAIPLKLHYLNFKYLRGAFEHRSKDVLKDGDRAIFIHDGKSKGTQNEYKLAQKMNIPHTFHQLEESEYDISVGFDITEEWDIDLDDVVADLNQEG